MKTKSIKEIDIETYLPVIIELLGQDKEVSLVLTGNSMAPFLHHLEDTIIISKPNGHYFKGQMVFYRRQNNQYVMHRIHHIDEKGNLFLVGDAQTLIEGPISKNQVFGVIHQVIRKGKLIKKGDLTWDFYANIWIRLVKWRPYLFKIRSLFKLKS